MLFDTALLVCKDIANQSKNINTQGMVMQSTDPGCKQPDYICLRFFKKIIGQNALNKTFRK